MHALLVTVGTDGDVFPYVGLGAKLRSRGCQVTLTASAQYEPLADAHGLAFQALVSAAENEELFGHPDFWNPLKNAPLMARWGARFIPRQFDLLSTLISHDTVLVASPGVLAAALVHEKAGTPLVNLVLQPWMIPSSIAPPIMPGFTFLRGAPRPVWRAFWRALDLVVDVLVGRRLNRLRASLGLRPLRRMLQDWFSPQLVLGMFPAWYGPPQADWPPQVRLLGFPMFDGGQRDDLPPLLEEFCRAGPPPVAFTFGTGMAHSAALFRSALAACLRLGVRGVFLTKYGDQVPEPLPPSIFHSAFAPFQKLFPLCAAVMHHGGIGTVAKALAAGTPQLVCPLCFDQIDNGERTKALGVGDWLASRQRDGRQVAGALTRLMTPEIRSRCRGIAARFGQGDALESAAQAVIEFATQRFSTPDLPRVG
jgi:UDP:flavonoid glycosyltransferase YjiC (YdhE family)